MIERNTQLYKMPKMKDAIPSIFIAHLKKD
jgi:hypothetical protein